MSPKNTPKGIINYKSGGSPFEMVRDASEKMSHIWEANRGSTGNLYDNKKKASTSATHVKIDFSDVC